MEVAAQPWLTLMMRGYGITLPPEAQRIVAAWATKTAFMLEYVDPVHPVHPHYLQWLYTKREPAPDVWVGLAAYAGEASIPAVEIYGRLLQIPGPEPAPLNDRNAIFTTVRIFRLVFQVWVWTDPPPQHVPIAYPFRLSDFVIPVWPTSVFTRTWPPAAVLDAEGLSKFCNNAS